MKNLTLSKTDYDILFEVIWAQKDLSLSDLRTAAKILSQFESSGILREREEGKLGLYTITDDVDIQLEDREFEFLLSAFNKISWNARVAKQVILLSNKLDNV